MHGVKRYDQRILPAAMKKTLYQILGVDPKASAQDIAAAYDKRVEEFGAATIRDPNKLVALQQAKEILSDPNQRAGYDVSLAARVAPMPADAVDGPAPGLIQVWGKWIVVGVVLIAVGIWWLNWRAPLEIQTRTPHPTQTQTQTPTQTIPLPQVASRTLEPAPQTVQLSEPSVSAGDAKETAPLVAAVQSQDSSPASPILGQWLCHESISGLATQYNFQPDGVLNLAASDGKTVTLSYELSGTALKLNGLNPARTFTIEELTALKMILHTGVEGRREVCAR